MKSKRDINWFFKQMLKINGDLPPPTLSFGPESAAEYGIEEGHYEVRDGSYVRMRSTLPPEVYRVGEPPSRS